MGFRSETATITSETLAALVKQFLATERPRRLRLYEYYRGEQGVDKGRVAAGRPNNRLVSNYAKYITDVIRNITDDELCMRFNSNVSPCVVCPPDGDHYLYLILPVRVFN